MLDPYIIKKDFPILERKIHGHPLVYFDNAATSQKPVQVISAISDYYSRRNANIHRAIHTLSQEASVSYEQARAETAGFFGADDPSEIIFVKNATEAVNLVACTYGEKHIGRNDEIVVSIAEHHANIVPWQMLCQRKGALLKFAALDKNGIIDVDSFRRQLTKRTKLVSISHISNVLGLVNPVKDLAALAHRSGAGVLIDGAQSAPKIPVSVKDLECDFFAVTGHKMLAPTGIGVLWAKRELLEMMPPFMGGGDMIREVTKDGFTPNIIPYKFEAGTPNIEGVAGLSAAIKYLKNLGMEQVYTHEKMLTEYALAKLRLIKTIKIYGKEDGKNSRLGVISFNLGEIHSHDVAQYLDNKGIAVRSGHHCAMPLHREVFRISSTVRVSLYIYNTKEDVDRLVSVLQEAENFFKHG